MWMMAQKEAEDEWVQYKWNEAGVSILCVEMCNTTDSQEEESMDKVTALLVPETKQLRLACTTKGLDYVDKA